MEAKLIQALKVSAVGFTGVFVSLVILSLGVWIIGKAVTYFEKKK